MIAKFLLQLRIVVIVFYSHTKLQTTTTTTAKYNDIILTVSFL